MYWLNMNWIVENWVPLLVALVLGYLIGWLLTGMSPARRVRELEARNADLEGKQRKNDRELADARSDNTKTKGSLTTALADLEAERTKAKGLEAKVAALEEAAEEPAAAASDDARDLAAGDAGDTGDTLDAGDSDDFESNEEVLLAEAVLQALEKAVDGEMAGAEGNDAAALTRQPAAVALAPDQIAESFSAVARTPAAIETDKAREIALTEAYSRAARLQEELEQRDKVLSMRQAELESVKAELLTSNAARHELDNRLVRAREDVASELAVLASTMIKMKDEALTRAEARIAALNLELDALRAEAVAEAPTTEPASEQPSDAA